MAAKLTRLTHKVMIQLRLVAESCTIFNSRCRRPVRKLLVTLIYVTWPTHLTLLHLMVLIMLDGDYILCIFALCSLFHSSVETFD
jgi:hypothetical protein